MASLTNAVYNGDHVDMTVLVDYAGKEASDTQISQDVFAHVQSDQFKWKHGKLHSYRMEHHMQPAAMVAQYLWSVDDDQNDEYALMLYENTQVSPGWYSAVAAALNAYVYPSGTDKDSIAHEMEHIFGFSLRHAMYNNNHAKTSATLSSSSDRTSDQFIVSMDVAPDGGCLFFPEEWRAFTEWYATNHAVSADWPRMVGLRTDAWYQKSPKHAWASWFLRFAYANSFYALHINSDDKHELVHSFPADLPGDFSPPEWQTATDSMKLDDGTNSVSAIEASAPSSFVKHGLCGQLVDNLPIARSVHEAVELAQKVAEHNIVIVISLNAGIEVLMNDFLCSLQRLGVHNVLIHALSEEMGHMYAQRGFAVYIDFGGLDPETFSSRPLNYGTVDYQRLMLVRTKFVDALLHKTSVNVLLTDADTVWLRDVRHHLLEPQYNEYHILAQRDDNTLCGGFLLLRNCDIMRKFWRDITDLHSGIVTRAIQRGRLSGIDESEQQSITNAALAGKHGVKFKLLPVNVVTNGGLWFGHPSDRHKYADTFVVHNNYVIGVNAKVERQKKDAKLWMLSNFDYQCKEIPCTVRSEASE
jgi:Nucleotide-diphospho-sugar transferase